MHWTVPCRKSSGKLRDFKQWSIPKSIRDELRIRDGDRHDIAISHIDYRLTLSFKITSGGEIRLPKAIAEQIEQQAKLHPDTSVTFAIQLGDEREAIAGAFEVEVAASKLLSPEARRSRLDRAARRPAQRKVEVVVYDRSPDVVAEVLMRAAENCERCKKTAPFLRRRDGTPYLEVHHKIQLAHGGDDTVENAEALCPNCHRRSHYGQLDA